jgi:formate dehydrogenase iron-sulfur subunit
MTEKAILYDPTKCTACRGCQVACKQWNEHEGEETENYGTYENPPDLSPQTWVKMGFTETERNGKLAWLFTRRACMHCQDASCSIVCPTGAIFKTDEGFVHIDQDWCIGCGNCVQACPFNVPHKDEHIGTARKCTACTSVGLNRQAAGLDPACVKSCPPAALTFGIRSQLITKAYQRIADLKAEGFSNATLYGVNELGGLHVLYVLDDSPEVYGLPESPQLASKDIIGKWLTGIATAGVIAALPLWFVFKRKQQLEAEQSKAKGGA